MKHKTKKTNKATEVVKAMLEERQNEIQIYNEILEENPNPSKTVEKIHEEVEHLTTLLNEHILHQPLKIDELEFTSLSEDFYRARITEMSYLEAAFKRLRKKLVRLLEYKTAIEVLPELNKKETTNHSLATK